MLQEDLNNVNKEPQSSEVLKKDKKAKDPNELNVWKRATLLALGLIGLNILAFILTYAFRVIPRSDRSAAVNLVAYSLLIILMITVVALDIPKHLKEFKGWKPYVFGLVFGVGIIVFDILYTNFVNLFYPINTSSNESGVRSIIDLFPFASIIILGIVGPLCEELAYRVGLFGLLKKVNRVLAYAVTGLVFGLLHFDFTSPDLITELIFLPTYIAPGIILSVAYDLFGLPCSWFAHSLNNLFAVILNIIAGYLQ